MLREHVAHHIPVADARNRPRAPTRSAPWSGVTAAAMAVFVGTACREETGLDPIEPAAFGELCGTVGPVALLPLGEDERWYGASLTDASTGRLFFEIWRIDMDTLSDPFPTRLESAIWSVGPCGEDPQRVAESMEIDVLNTTGRTLDYIVGLNEEGIFAVDPEGTRPARRLAKAGAANTWITGGRLILDGPDSEGTFTLSRLRIDDVPDPWLEVPSVEVLAEGVDAPDWNPEWAMFPSLSIERSRDSVFFVDQAHRLIEIDAEGTSSPVVDDVKYFSVSWDGRHVLWQDRASSDDDPELAVGDVYHLDRATGERRFLAVTSLRYDHWPVSSTPAAEGEETFAWMTLALGTWCWGPYYVENLSTGLSATTPKNHHVLLAIDSRHVATTDWSEGHYTYDIVTRALSRVAPGRAARVLWFADSVEYLYGKETCGLCSEIDAEGRWIRAFFDGREDVVLAKRATGMHRELPGGYRLTAIDRSYRGGGRLILIEPGTLEEALIDTAVDRLWRSAEGYRPDSPHVIYSVIDPERSGIWMARLAAVPGREVIDEPLIPSRWHAMVREDPEAGEVSGASPTRPLDGMRAQGSAGVHDLRVD